MYVIQWKGRSYHCVGTNITRILYHAARAASTVSCWFSLLVEESALSISKTDAYFSITSARKAANALHSSSVGAEYFEEVGLFSVRWKLFNRQLHFLVAELWQSSGFFRNIFWSIRLNFLSVPFFPALFLYGDCPQCRKQECTFPAGGHRCGHGRYPVDAAVHPASDWWWRLLRQGRSDSQVVGNRIHLQCFFIKQIFGKHFTGCWQSPEDAADAVLSDAQYSFLLFAKQQ